MRLLAEGTDDEEADAELREDAVSTYVEMLDKQNIPDVLVQIICWVGPVGVVSGCGLGVCPVGVLGGCVQHWDVITKFSVSFP